METICFNSQVEVADQRKKIGHMKTIGIGIQDFAKIADKNMFYVDKTAFIKEWWGNLHRSG